MPKSLTEKTVSLKSPTARGLALKFLPEKADIKKPNGNNLMAKNKGAKKCNNNKFIGTT